MNSISKKIYILISWVIPATAGIFAQENDFYKKIVKESMKPSFLFKSMDSLSLVNPDYTTLDVNKKPLPKIGFNYKQNSLYLQFNEEEYKKILTISPGFFAPYTNEHLPFDFYYDNTLIFSDGKWMPASSLFGISPSTIIYYLNKLVPDNQFFNDSLPPAKSKKEKALRRIKKVYDVPE